MYCKFRINVVFLSSLLVIGLKLPFKAFYLYFKAITILMIFQDTNAKSGHLKNNLITF